jgi:hypothetical protein
MRRLAGIGIMLCALAGCQGIPAVIRIEVDGSTLQFKKKEPPASATETPAAASPSVDAPKP